MLQNEKWERFHFSCMQAENSNMIFHSFSWAFWLGREILSHKLWQKHRPTRHRSDLSEGPIRPADHLLEGETVTEASTWRPNGWSVHKRNSSRGCETIVWDGQCMTNPSMSSFTGSSAGLSHSFCSCLPQLGEELSGNPGALALWRHECTSSPYQHHSPGHRPAAIQERLWHQSGYWQTHSQRKPDPHFKIWYASLAHLLSRCIGCIYCCIFSIMQLFFCWKMIWIPEIHPR